MNRVKTLKRDVDSGMLAVSSTDPSLVTEEDEVTLALTLTLTLTLTRRKRNDRVGRFVQSVVTSGAAWGPWRSMHQRSPPVCSPVVGGCFWVRVRVKSP